ncbi:MAG: carbamoyl transferase, partial [Candidatus Magasanikbacteria bacterium]|nr:carbamoyl transferase [Candidatus Magasanikbacteria bacterium]
MKILGIMWEENSTAALYIEGKIVACASEERFSREKNDERYPKRAIEYVLQMGGVKAEELDHVAFTGKMWDVVHVLTRRYSTFSIADRLREQHDYWYPLLYEKKDINYFDVFKDKLDFNQYPYEWQNVLDFTKNVGDYSQNRASTQEFFEQFRRNLVSKHLGIPAEKVIFIDHHEAHAAYAYHSSPHNFKESYLVLTADAWGDNLNATISIAKEGKLDRIASSKDFRGAQLYRYVTQILGMKPDQDEYKVMGMAPYGKPKYYEPVRDIFMNMQQVEGLDFIYKERPSDMYFYFKDKLEGQRFDNIAAGLQAYIQDIVIEWTKNAVEKTGIKKIRFAGGIAMNVKAMMEIAKNLGVEIFVSSAPSDESTAVGSIYVLANKLMSEKGESLEKIAQPWNDSYLGPDVNDAEVE